jgi:hypothetical protein
VADVLEYSGREGLRAPEMDFKALKY